MFQRGQNEPLAPPCLGTKINFKPGLKCTSSDLHPGLIFKVLVYLIQQSQRFCFVTRVPKRSKSSNVLKRPQPSFTVL